MSARGWRAELYGQQNAGIYDQIYPRIDQTIVDGLIRLAAARRVLALGVGTGRCAARLAEHGLAVCGVDASTAMLQQCRTRAPGVQLVQADLSALPFCGGFGLAYSLVSTLSLLPDLHHQQRCLQGVAAALEAGGIFVDESSLVSDSDPCVPIDQELQLDSTTPASYRVRYLPINAARLQMLADHAGLRLICRWRNWGRQPWQPGDSEAISIYQRA